MKRPATLSVKLPGKAKNPFWYLDHKDALVDVTSNASNEKLGINAITVFEPTEYQRNQGVIARVFVDTICGTFQNINIEEAASAPGALKINPPSRQINVLGNKSYVNDFVIKLACKAQILSYVSTLVKS